MLVSVLIPRLYKGTVSQSNIYGVIQYMVSLPQRKICCLLAIISVTAIFFVLQSKEAKQWVLAQQQRHVHSFHDRCFVALTLCG